MIKVQKSKLIKIIRDRRQTDRQMKLRSNTHGCELIIVFSPTCSLIPTDFCLRR